MVASAPPIGSKYALSYVGGHTTDAARVKSLTGAGPLTIATDHVLALMLPDAWEVDTTTGRVDISQNDVHEFIIPGAMFDPIRFGSVVDRQALGLVDHTLRSSCCCIFIDLSVAHKYMKQPRSQQSA